MLHSNTATRYGVKPCRNSPHEGKKSTFAGVFFHLTKQLGQVLLSNDIVGDFAVDVGESKIPAGVLVSQFLVIQTHKMQHIGLNVPYGRLIQLGPPRKKIRGAVVHAALDADTHHPAGECIRV